MQPHHATRTSTTAQHSFAITGDYAGVSNTNNNNTSNVYDTTNLNNNVNNNGDEHSMYSSVNMEDEINANAGSFSPLSVCTTHTLSVEVCTFMHQCNYV